MKQATRLPLCRAFALSVLIGLSGVVGLVAPATEALAVAPSLRSEDDTKDLVATVLDQLVAGQVKDAFRRLSQYWTLPPSELAERIVEAGSERSALRRRLGLSLGWESLSFERAGERVIRIRSLERFERGALVWRFVFYRADTVWVIDSVRSSSDLEAAF